jgi:uncharacterized membrane protein
MGKGRLEAFSDGVIAIIITIMVLELKPPHEQSLEGLRPLLPALLGYILSFVYVGIYWNNHHHLLHNAGRVNGRVLWANLHLLFWLSLMPFLAGWLGESRFAPWPVAAYGAVLLLCAVAWQLLCRELMACHRGLGSAGLLRRAGFGRKAWVSVALYAAGVGLAVTSSLLGEGWGWLAWAGSGLYTLVAGVWFVPDRRLERGAAGDTPGEGEAA